MVSGGNLGMVADNSKDPMMGGISQCKKFFLGMGDFTGKNRKMEGPCTDNCDCESMGLKEQHIEAVLLPSGHYRRVVRDDKDLNWEWPCNSQYLGISSLPESKSSGDFVSDFLATPLSCCVPRNQEDDSSSEDSSPRVGVVAVPPIIDGDDKRYHSDDHEDLISEHGSLKSEASVIKSNELPMFQSDDKIVDALSKETPEKLLVQIGTVENISISHKGFPMFVAIGDSTSDPIDVFQDPYRRTSLMYPQYRGYSNEKGKNYALVVNKQLVFGLDTIKRKIIGYVCSVHESPERDSDGKVFVTTTFDNGLVELDADSMENLQKRCCVVDWRYYNLLDDFGNPNGGRMWLRFLSLPKSIGPALQKSRAMDTIEYGGEKRRRSSLLPLKVYVNADKTVIDEKTLENISVTITTTHSVRDSDRSIDPKDDEHKHQHKHEHEKLVNVKTDVLKNGNIKISAS